MLLSRKLSRHLKHWLVGTTLLPLTSLILLSSSLAEDHAAVSEHSEQPATESAVAKAPEETVANSSAATESSTSTESENADTQESTDVVLLLDASGSMRITDPGRLRDQGAQLLVELLRQTDRIGIIKFAEDATVIRDLLPKTPSASKEIAEEISKIDNSGPYTDILAGIKKAKEMLEANRREGSRQVIILMSDGKLEPDPRNGSAELLSSQLSNEQLPVLKAQGIKVYTLSFSEKADRDFLSQIAAATDAIHWFTSDVATIHQSYANLFLSVKKPQVLPLTKKGFPLDSGIQEATFYINREGTSDISVESPSGASITYGTAAPGVKWYRGDKFDVITIEQPEAGDWKIIGLASQESFAALLTNLKLVTDLPEGKIMAGDKLVVEAKLFEGPKPVVLPEMTSAIQFGYQVTPTDKISEPIFRGFLVDDGTNGDRRAADGIFSTTVEFEDEGEYKLTVLARAPTFIRQQQFPLHVGPRIISLSIITVSGAVSAHSKPSQEGHHEEKGVAAEHHEPSPPVEEESGNNEFFRATLSNDVSGYKKREVSIVAVNQDRKRFKLSATRSKDNDLFYEADVGLLPEDGEYEIIGTFTGENKKGVEYSAKSNVLQYSYKKPTDVPKQEVVELKKDAPPPPPEVESSPVPYIILVIILNAGIGAAGVALIKKQVSKVKVDDTKPYEPSRELLAKIEELNQRVALTEVDLTDPMYASDGSEPPPTSSSTETPPAASPPEQETKDSGPEQAEDTSAEPKEAEQPPAEESAPAEEGEGQE